jgi:hypothetical protein
MELIVFITVLVALVALSERFGVDSRDKLEGHEGDLAALGFTHEQRVLPRRDPRAL